MNKKRIVCLFIVLIMAAGVFAGCKTDSSGGNDASGGSADSSGSGVRSTVEFWYHDGNQISTDLYEPLMARFNASQDQYEGVYVGIPTDSWNQKVNVAIATNTLPQALSVRCSDTPTYAAQNVLLSLEDTFAGWAEKDYYMPDLIEFNRSLGAGTLYSIPIRYNMDICWYNVQKFNDKGIEGPPETLEEFLVLCEEYADPQNGEYFYSFRGSDPINNWANFVFTYVDETSFFDDQGVCIINQPQFVEAFEAYVSIYANGWVSRNSVTNGYKEIVAEFASGSSMFLNHNSSSLPDHLQNLGEGNFAPAEFPRNSADRYVYTVAQPLSYGVCQGTPEQEAGGLALLLYMCSEAEVSTVCNVLGSLPAHTKVFEHEWYTSNTYLDIYSRIAADETILTVQLPLWLTEYSDFRNNLVTTGLQAVMLGEQTVQETLDEWAEYLTEAQQAYMAQ